MHRTYEPGMIVLLVAWQKGVSTTRTT